MNVMVGLYIDKSQRLCATMKVYEYLTSDSPYQKDDQVEGIVYEVSDNFGAFVAVDGKIFCACAKERSTEKSKTRNEDPCESDRSKTGWKAEFKCP